MYTRTKVNEIKAWAVWCAVCECQVLTVFPLYRAICDALPQFCHGYHRIINDENVVINLTQLLSQKYVKKNANGKVSKAFLSPTIKVGHMPFDWNKYYQKNICHAPWYLLIYSNVFCPSHLWRKFYDGIGNRTVILLRLQLTVIFKIK